ncbi:MAG TPA: biotin synthase BioB [Deltaproteobacteria bacterium]|nr:biotin synthase BioB [Candidatus Binatota bacterium]HIL12544.1 biotin synthase BioB [Deltaproteobacteria bacterium]
MTEGFRHNWTVAEAREIHDTSLGELLYLAQGVHREHHDPKQVQLCSLLSIKTGGCPEDCSYCPQSAHYEADVENEALIDVEAVLASASEARDAGATRFCMGAAWRDVRSGSQFDSVLDMVRGVNSLGMESCVTLGMLNAEQAGKLKDAGLTAYNHNIDTSREYYDKIITTRNFDERLETLAHVREAGITVCCGGIIGMGESINDRCAMLVELANLPRHPESVPVNALVPVEGTPLGDREPVEALELVRMVACARVMMPASVVRLSAGRSRLSEEAQLLCFMAGANSIFFGEKLLTTGNPDTDADRRLLEQAGLTAASINIQAETA